MSKGKRLSRAIIEKRLSQAWLEAIEDSFGLSPTQAKQLMKGAFVKGKKRAGLGGHDPGARTVNAGLAMALGDIGRDYIRRTKIRTDADLARELQKINQARENWPTETRKAMKTLSSMLPRRGGPGRQPKLNPKEASKACDHIAVFIRQKHTLKEALLMMAESSTTILGKKVGARTLQKAWDSRDKLTGE